jgi:hypothetical protein
VGYVPPFQEYFCAFTLRTTFLSGLRTTFSRIGYKDSSFLENNKTFCKKFNVLLK